MKPRTVTEYIGAEPDEAKAGGKVDVVSKASSKKMRSPALVGCLALLLAPTIAMAAAFSSFDDKHSCPAITNSHQCARSIEAALKLPYVTRVGEQQLQVTLLDRRVVTLSDRMDESGVQHYSAVEALAGERLLVLHRQFVEGSSYSLLDRATGNVTHLQGYPVFSADLRWIAVAQVDVGAGYVANALQIFRYSEGTLSLSYDARPERWGPARVAWKSPEQLSYVHATSECFIEMRHPCREVTLTLGEQGWR
jgi:hypothetical protein